MKKILMLHGINHNMFGKRDPVQYGTITLAEIDARCASSARSSRRRRRQLPDQRRGRDVRAHSQGVRRQDGRRGDQRRRVDALQLRHPRRARDPHGARSSRSTCRTSMRARRSGIIRCSARSSEARSAASASTAICWDCAPPFRPAAQRKPDANIVQGKAMTSEFAGKVVVVSGGSRGIGRGIAAAFAAARRAARCSRHRRRRISKRRPRRSRPTPRAGPTSLRGRSAPRGRLRRRVSLRLGAARALRHPRQFGGRDAGRRLR